MSGYGKTRSSHLEFTKVIMEFANAIVNNPRLTANSYCKQRNLSSTVQKKLSKLAKTDEFQAILEGKRILKTIQSLSDTDTTALQLKPISNLISQQVLDRLLSGESNKVPIKTLLDFSLKYARLEAELGDTLPKSTRKNTERILEQMKGQMAESITNREKGGVTAPNVIKPEVN